MKWETMILIIACLLVLPFATAQEAEDKQEQTERALAEALHKKVAGGTDVSWLEQVVNGQAKDLPDAATTRINLNALRSLSYIRLGAIGSNESVDAIRRIDDELRKIVPNAPRVNGRFLPSAARHEGGYPLKPLAQTKGPDGTTYALIASGEMGDIDLFLIASGAPESNVWTRPLLIPNRIYRGVSDPVLEMRGNDELIFRFVQHEPGGRSIMEGYTEPPRAAPQLGPQEWRLSLTELGRDSDGDGLTDIEEQRVGLDPRRADSDGDGIPDGQDICPNLALKDAASGDDAVLVQKAFTAIYGMLGSRQVIFVEPGVKPRVHFYGYGGPIIYGIDHKQWQKDHPEGAVFLSWEIKQHSSSAAIVRISDYEGPLAAWGTKVKLKNIKGEWVVVGTENEWIS